MSDQNLRRNMRPCVTPTDRHFDVDCSMCGDTGTLPIAGFPVKGGGFRRTGEAPCPMCATGEQPIDTEEKEE